MRKHLTPRLGNIERYLGRAYAVVISFFILFFFWLFTIRQNYACAILEVSVLAVIVAAVRIWRERRGTTDPVVATASRSDRLTPVLLFLVTFAIRFQYCVFMDPVREQTSDFARTLYYAIHGHYASTGIHWYNAIYTHKFFHGWFLYHLGFRSQMLIYTLQCVYAGLIAALLYLIGRRIRDRRLGLIASVLYILWPIQTLYQAQTSEEHPAAFIAVLLVWLFIAIGQRIETLEERPGIDRTLILEYVVAGILCGLSPLFKDWAVICLIAVLIGSIYLAIHLTRRQRIWLAAGILAVLVLRTGVHTAFDHVAGRVMGVPIGASVVVAHMYETLDPEFSTGHLQHDKALSDEYRQIVEDYDWDFDAANEVALSIVRYKVLSGLDKMPGLLLRKGIDANSGTDNMIAWSFQGLDRSVRSTFQGLISLLTDLEQAWYVLMVLCIMLCALLFRDRYMYLVLLLIDGGIASQLLVEAQQRYKYSIEAVWCLAAAGGLYALLYTDWTSVRGQAVQIWRTVRRSSDSGGETSSAHGLVPGPDDKGWSEDQRTLDIQGARGIYCQREAIKEAPLC